jgi:hypothetical protein
MGNDPYRVGNLCIRRGRIENKGRGRGMGWEPQFM